MHKISFDFYKHGLAFDTDQDAFTDIHGEPVFVNSNIHPAGADMRYHWRYDGLIVENRFYSWIDIFDMYPITAYSDIDYTNDEDMSELQNATTCRFFYHVASMIHFFGASPIYRLCQLYQYARFPECPLDVLLDGIEFTLITTGGYEVHALLGYNPESVLDVTVGTIDLTGSDDEVEVEVEVEVEDESTVEVVDDVEVEVDDVIDLTGDDDVIDEDADIHTFDVEKHFNSMDPNEFKDGLDYDFEQV